MEHTLNTTSFCDDNVIASVTTTITRELFSQVFPLVFKKKYQRLILIIGLLCVATGSICLAIQMLTKHLVSLWVAFFFAGIFIVIWSILLPKRKEKSTYKVLCAKNYGNPPIRTIHFLEKEMILEDSDGIIGQYKYDTIKQSQETPDGILLLFDDLTATILSKSGFTKGNLSDILPLIQL